MLTADQFQAIDECLKKSGIIYQEVYDELFDHFVNAIDDKVAKSIPFSDALQATIDLFNGKKGLLTIQRNHNKTAERLYNRQLFQIIGGCFNWPTLPITLLGSLSIYLMITIVPNIMIISYALMAVGFIPFFINTLLNARYLLAYFQQKRQRAFSLEGFTLLSHSLGLALSMFYPNLMIWLGFIKPEHGGISTGEQLVLFIVGGVFLLATYAITTLTLRYAKSFQPAAL